MSPQADLKKLILTHTRRLQKLKQQQALAGPFGASQISIEIEDIEAEIKKLQTELETLEAGGLVDLETSTQSALAADLPQKSQSQPAPANLAAAQANLARLPLDTIPDPASLPPGSRMPSPATPSLSAGRKICAAWPEV